VNDENRAAERRTVADQLLAGWEAAPEHMRGDRRKNPEVTLAVFGLAAHVHRLARAALLLIDQEMVLEALPLVRSAFETALTCAWINEQPDALPALRNKEDRQWSALVDTLSRPAWRTDDETKARWAALSHEPESTSSNQPIRYFKQLCDDLLQAGDQAYGLYRIMSASVHPTINLISRYLREPDEGHANLSHIPSPDPSPELWVLLLGGSMVWAGRAFDFNNPSRPRRNELRVAARTLRVPVSLVLTNAARVRVKRPRAR
jgi:hypothetical protein